MEHIVQSCCTHVHAIKINLRCRPNTFLLDKEFIVCPPKKKQCFVLISFISQFVLKKPIPKKSLQHPTKQPLTGNRTTVTSVFVASTRKSIQKSTSSCLAVCCSGVSFLKCWYIKIVSTIDFRYLRPSKHTQIVNSVQFVSSNISTFKHNWSIHYCNTKVASNILLL